jgi:hypothetical protein
MGAERKPDFSGEYALNPQASVLAGGAATVRSAVLRIEHREPLVRCQGEFTFEGTNFNYTLERVSDGRDVCLGLRAPLIARIDFPPIVLHRSSNELIWTND